MGISEAVQGLMELQRQRVIVEKNRIMQSNGLLSVVAVSLGYRTSLDPADRERLFEEAGRVIAAVHDGDQSHPYTAIILQSGKSIATLEEYDGDIKKKIERLAKRLPVAGWVTEPDQNGFGLRSLGVVVGECGDLSNYANPAKLWKRMGCAPHGFNGKTMMGATWKSGAHGKLPAEEWERFGYSPRRRSVAYVIGENLVRGNYVRGTAGDALCDTENTSAGPYRARYDAAKAAIQAAHPEYKKLRCHRHGMLLATKMLLKMLWRAWNQHR